jgi:hypothetical protein
MLTSYFEVHVITSYSILEVDCATTFTLLKQIAVQLLPEPLLMLKQLNPPLNGLHFTMCVNFLSMRIGA